VDSWGFIILNDWKTSEEMSGTGRVVLYKCDKPPPGQEALIKKGWFWTVTREWPEVCVLIACQPSQGWHLQSHHNHALLLAWIVSYILYANTCVLLDRCILRNCHDHKHQLIVLHDIYKMPPILNVDKYIYIFGIMNLTNRKFKLDTGTRIYHNLFSGFPIKV
jgi:hypothetical protein